MNVVRIVPNILTDDPAGLSAFYARVFSLDVAMNMGFITTMQPQGGGSAQTPQLSLASEGGAGTPLPALSIEVEDLACVIAACRDLAVPIEYGPVDEPWGVRRLYLRDPAGTLVNVLTHTQSEATT